MLCYICRLIPVLYPEEECEADISTDSLVSEENELQVSPLPASSTTFYELSTMKVLPNPHVCSLLAFCLSLFLFLFFFVFSFSI